MLPSRTASAVSPGSCWGRSHSEKFSRARPSVTSFWTSQDRGATVEYQGQTVALLWQSKHARAASRRVWGLSQGGY